MSKLWQKNYQLDSIIESFTVGEDYVLDSYLVPSDCFGSMAHAKMLAKIGILSEQEFEDLKRGLGEIIKLHAEGQFKINKSDEDCHTAIEMYLVNQLGDAGKKIHTGRSRNDQVIAAIRLYTREFLTEFASSCSELAEILLAFAEKYRNVPMPGRTHMQIAMPSSVGLWAASFAEQIMEDLKYVELASEINNRCPLGSAASYGVPIELDREYVSTLLGFDEVQNNVLFVQNSRGRTEAHILDAVESVVLTLAKMAQDLILFTMPEFAYFSLPDKLCTGSSIMPQKKNPDGLELIRAKSSTLSSYASAIKNIVRILPSGYNRDFQETKEPFMRGLTLGLNCVEIMKLTIRELKVNEDKLVDAFTPDIFATDYAFDLVKTGMPFRAAYKEVGLNIDKLSDQDPRESIQKRTSTGTPGNLCLEKSVSEIEKLRARISDRTDKNNDAKQGLVGFDFSLFYPII